MRRKRGRRISGEQWSLGRSFDFCAARSCSAKPDAAFVLLEGSDSGRLFSDSPALPYSQLVPLSKCLDTSSLVAFKYNDLALPKRNGFPARALFPGWYGMDSVKWLRRIAVVQEADRIRFFTKAE